MADKKTYVLKSDRSKKVQVLQPMFGLVNYTADDGKPQTMERSEFNAQYEPELAPVDATKASGLSPGGKNAGSAKASPAGPPDDERLARLEKGLGILLQRTNTLMDQVDAIHHVVVVPEPPKTGTGG